jgi:hypothetical protein
VNTQLVQRVRDLQAQLVGALAELDRQNPRDDEQGYDQENGRPEVKLAEEVANSVLQAVNVEDRCGCPLCRS